MASDTSEFNKNIENLRSSVKKTFAHIYASLKARELKTLRQLDAIRKQCQNDDVAMKICARNLHIDYKNESTLLDDISEFGNIDFKNLSIDCTAFTLEDYVSPNDDHMYSYKDIEELPNDDDLEAIEEAALKQITQTDQCVCHVNIRTEDVSKKFRDVYEEPVTTVPEQNIEATVPEDNEVLEDQNEIEVKQEDPEILDEDVKKIDPTDEWLNSIKNQTETEPSQVNSVMEHRTIACS